MQPRYSERKGFFTKKRRITPPKRGLGWKGGRALGEKERGTGHGGATRYFSTKKEGQKVNFCRETEKEGRVKCPAM